MRTLHASGAPAQSGRVTHRPHHERSAASHHAEIALRRLMQSSQARELESAGVAAIAELRLLAYAGPWEDAHRRHFAAVLRGLLDAMEERS